MCGADTLKGDHDGDDDDGDIYVQLGHRETHNHHEGTRKESE